MKRIFVCIECPRGCELTAETTQDGVNVTGNFCPRGERYAEAEMTCPRRIVTSTVRLTDGRMLSVKTDGEVKKEDVFVVMQKIKKLHPAPPVCIGNVLEEHISENINLIATGNA